VDIEFRWIALLGATGMWARWEWRCPPTPTLATLAANRSDRPVRIFLAKLGPNHAKRGMADGGEPDKNGDIAIFLAELERLGEDEVRFRVLGGVYGKAGDRKCLADDWLKRRESDRARISNAATASAAARAAAAAEQAADAAQEQSRACAAMARELLEQARTANEARTFARLAAAIAGVALVVSVIALVCGLR